MIIGITGPVQDDMDTVLSLLTSEKSIQVVNSIEVLRNADRKMVNSLPIHDYHKKYYLKKLEQEFGTVIVTGNIILDEQTCQWLLQTGNVVVVVSRDKLEKYPKDILDHTEKYWDDKVTQRYHLEVRFNSLYDRLHKVASDNLYLINISEDNSDDLDSLIENCSNLEESIKIENNITKIVDLVTIRKEDNTMTMEESIRKAMAELGMDVEEPDTDSNPEEKPQKQSKTAEKKSKQVKPQPKPKEQPKDEEEQFMNEPEEEEQEVSEQPENEEEGDKIDAVFVKITGNTMALMVPEGLKFEQQEVGGIVFNVATVGVPDLNNKKLQELTLIVGNADNPKVIKRVPIITQPEKKEQPKPTAKKTKQPVKVMVESDDMKDLQEEKSRLDAEIKKYRAEGDIDTVNELRKQRRAVRNKINRLK